MLILIQWKHAQRLECEPGRQEKERSKHALGLAELGRVGGQPRGVRGTWLLSEEGQGVGFTRLTTL